MEKAIKITAENINQYKFFKVPATSMPWAIHKNTVHHNYVYDFMTNDAVFANEDAAKAFAIAKNIRKPGARLLEKELPAEEISIDCSYRLIN